MIQIRNLHKSFGKLEVLKGIDLDIQDGETVAIIGASGAGKSTLLRCINYLEEPQKGTIAIDGESYDYETMTSKTAWKLRQKSSMVFQNYNLFQHRTVLENITDPLIHAKKMNKEDAKRRAVELLQMVGLEEKAGQYPRKLSGGQQQRVGIARAMAVEPKVILFDEPTSSLDPELVKEVLRVIKRLSDQKQTMVIVTHEMQFAKLISDKIVFLDDAVIQEEGSTKELFENSENVRLRNFLQAISLDDL